jgi:hypothetical protein
MSVQPSPDCRYRDNCQNEKPKKKTTEVAISIRWAVINLIRIIETPSSVQLQGSQFETLLAATFTIRISCISHRYFIGREE